MPSIELKPETIGAIIGGAFIAIATALGMIRGRGDKKSKKADTDEMERVNTVIDIVADLRAEVEALERRLQESKAECARRIDEIVAKYDQQLEEMARKNAELKRRLDTYEGGK